MSDTIIKVENLSKSYLIGHERQQGYMALRDVVANNAKGFFKGIKNIVRGKDLVDGQEIEEFWALKDINFEIKKGDAVGIIGRNGAGKSTLLKILSRITEPTKGRIELNGRVASLLEVGTGFHPELSGRENIYLNGAILGMSRAEIKSKFDEIVDFSGVEKFLDTPVKRYSSGMYVRLAFAVAAHLEPEILVVDEVLAVGDAEFQKKCLGKMDDVSKKEGRTVLFVSHQMGTISQLCNTSLLLDKGSLIKAGPTSQIIDHYLQHRADQVEKIERKDGFPGNHFKTIYMADKNLSPKVDYGFEEEIVIKLQVVLPEYNPALELALRLMDKHRNAVFTIHEKIDTFINGEPDINLAISIPPKFLTPGRYSWVMCINHPGSKLYDLQDDILPFTIIETGSDFARYEGANYGSVFANYSINRI
ncbi:MAG TPA: polysaccharide ABC transporter ATP-binding protein [Ferruginibacter sp.]|jgi:lipopolysaccharide transport system ATP-binding protein|nr:polysaccharide ABC transporter ATP-binding protein [Ferruginibacter sp.]